MKNYKSNSAGFSLTELMIAIAILSIVSGMAIPSFGALIARNQLTTQSNAILTSLYLARSYAITQQKNVHICQLNINGTETCSANTDSNRNWSKGWLVFADLNGNNNFDADDSLITVLQTNETTNIVFNQRGRLRFFPDGSARSAGFYLCNKEYEQYKHIYLLYSGRARVNETLSKKQKSICTSIQEA